MIVPATIGSKALYLLFLWLASAAAAAWLADRKGYGERLGLTFGLILTVVGLLIVLLLPGRPGSKWREGEVAPEYPVRLEVDYPQHQRRLTTLLHGVLVIPHLVALAGLGLGALVAWLSAGFAVLLTGRYPEPVFGYLVGTMRWAARVWAYLLLLSDRYPPFSLNEAPDYPVRIAVDYPPRIARWRPLVNWIMVAPLSVVTLVLMLATGVLAIEAWVAILVTGRYPQELFVNVSASLRWTLRQNVFGLGMTEQYPPLAWA